MLREVIDDPAFSLTGSHPVRLFIGSGMPTGLWRRVIDVFKPAHVLEFFATTDGQAVLANVSGAKLGSKGRALPGGGDVELAAYDAEDDLILEDNHGFVRKADTNEVGVLLAHPRGPVDPTASVKRGVFAAADTWVSTNTSSGATRTATTGWSTTVGWLSTRRAARSSPRPSTTPSGGSGRWTSQ